MRTMLLVWACVVSSTAAAGLEPLPAAEWTPEAAAHLLRRAGFGGTREEIRELFGRGLDGAVDHLLDWDGAPDPGVLPAPISVTSRPGPAELAGKSREERQEIQRRHRQADQVQYALVREWWVQSMIRTAHPLRERMTLYWHGHFPSGYRDVRNSYHLYVQNTLFRRHAAGNFRELLHAISKDPAMLEYLDNNRNRKGRPNENYAREVMELFTLGVGNYTEGDIKEAARALTGWTFLGNHFVFSFTEHDDGEKTLLGRSGPFDGDRFLDVLLEQEAAPRFLAARLFRYFAHDDPPPEVVEELARTLRRHDWELRPVLRALFSSRAFYASAGSKVKSPVELLVGLYRSLGMEPAGAAGLSFMAESLGQSLMQPPSVKGWPGGRDWITTSTLLNRYNLAGMLVGLQEDKRRTVRAQRINGLNRLLRAVQQKSDRQMMAKDLGMQESMSMAMQMYGGEGGYRRAAVFDVLSGVRALGLEQPGDIVDHFAATLLAVPADDATRATLVACLTGPDGAFSLDHRDTERRLHALLRLIVSTPAFQLC